MDLALEYLARYLSSYTYLGLFLILSVGAFGLPIPEEVVLIAAGLFVAQGTTELLPTLLVCAAGQVIGDLLLFAVGRRYGWLSGDLNPIHLADRGARMFGFDRAVAHGMWSMARAVAALGAGALAPPVQLHVEFKFPLFMPAVARLEHWAHEARHVFVLKDAGSERPHLAGSTQKG